MSVKIFFRKISLGVCTPNFTNQFSRDNVLSNMELQDSYAIARHSIQLRFIIMFLKKVNVKKILTVTVIQMMTCTVLYDCNVILYMTIIITCICIYTSSSGVHTVQCHFSRADLFLGISADR